MTSAGSTQLPDLNRTRYRLAPALLAAVLGLGLAGCDDAPSPGTAPGPRNSDGGQTQRHAVGGGANSDPAVTVSLSVDRTRITVADRIALTLVTEAAPGFAAEWDPPSPAQGQELATLGDFTIAGHTSRTVPGRSATAMIEHTLVLEPFLDGEKVIPSLGVRVRGGLGVGSGGADSLAQTVSTRPVTITVAPILKEDEREQATLAAPPGPIAASLVIDRPSPLILFAAAISCSAWIAAFAVARLTSTRRAAVEDPTTEARRLLASVRSQLSEAQADPFGPAGASTAAAATELASVIRGYLERGLKVPALGATAEEIAARLASSPIGTSTGARVGAVLRDLESAAFAPARPRAAVLLEHLAAAESLVEQFSGRAAADSAEAAA